MIKNKKILALQIAKLEIGNKIYIKLTFGNLLKLDLNLAQQYVNYYLKI